MGAAVAERVVGFCQQAIEWDGGEQILTPHSRRWQREVAAKFDGASRQRHVAEPPMEHAAGCVVSLEFFNELLGCGVVVEAYEAGVVGEYVQCSAQRLKLFIQWHPCFSVEAEFAGERACLDEMPEAFWRETGVCVCQGWVAADTPDRRYVCPLQDLFGFVERSSDREDDCVEFAQVVFADADVDVRVKVERRQPAHANSSRSSAVARRHSSNAARGE